MPKDKEKRRRSTTYQEGKDDHAKKKKDGERRVKSLQEERRGTSESPRTGKGGITHKGSDFGRRQPTKRRRRRLQRENGDHPMRVFSSCRDLFGWWLLYSVFFVCCCLRLRLMVLLSRLLPSSGDVLFLVLSGKYAETHTKGHEQRGARLLCRLFFSEAGRHFNG